MRSALPAILGLVLLCPAGATAQAPPPPPPSPATQTAAIRTMELDNAITQALARNPTVGTATAAVARANALLQQSRSLILPAINANVSNVTNDNSRAFEGTVTQPRSQVAFGATASAPLLAFSRWADVNQARAQVEVAERLSVDTRQQVAVAVAEAYLAVIVSRRQVEVDQRALDNSRAHFDYADKRLQGGMGSRINQLRASQEVATDEARIETTRLALRRAQEALGVLVAEDGPVDAGAEPAFEPPVTISDEEWMAARPDLQVQTATVRAAELLVRDAWKNWLPDATVAFTPQYITPSGIFQSSRSWQLVFSVSQPVFQRGLRAESALKRVVLSQAEFARRSAEIQARSEVRIAREAVAANERGAARARAAANDAAEVLRIATAAFEVGATTNLEVIDAQRSARDADSTAALAEDALRRARLELLIALGRFRR